MLVGLETKISDLSTSPSDIKFEMFFKNPVAHPTTLIRRSVLINEGLNYRLDLLHLEDWGLWYDISLNNEIANISLPLLRYRLEGQNITEKNKKTHSIRIKNWYKIMFLDLTDNKLSDKFFDLHYNFSFGYYNGENLDEISSYLIGIKDVFKKNGFDKSTVDLYMNRRLDSMF